MIDEESAFDQSVINDWRTYDNIWKIATVVKEMITQLVVYYIIIISKTIIRL